MVQKKAVAKAPASPAVRRKKSVIPAVEEGLRATRQRRIHAELIAAGTAMFRDRGFDETTVSDIANEVGISRRTFFRYFKTKDDLVFKWMDEQGEFVMPMLASRPAAEQPLLAMHNTFVALAEHHDKEPERVKFLTKLIFDTPGLEGRYHGEHAKWEAEFVRILKRGRRPRAADAFALQVQVAASITAFVVAIRMWARANHRLPLRPFVDAAFKALGAGVVKNK